MGFVVSSLLFRVHLLWDSPSSSITPCILCTLPRAFCFMHLRAFPVPLTFRMRSLAFLIRSPIRSAIRNTLCTHRVPSYVPSAFASFSHLSHLAFPVPWPLWNFHARFRVLPHQFPFAEIPFLYGKLWQWAWVRFNCYQEKMWLL